MRYSLHIVLLLFAAFTTGCGRQESVPELLGTWQADTGLTRAFEGNAVLDKKDLEMPSWLFGTQMKMRVAFDDEGRMLFRNAGETTEFTYSVVTRDQDHVRLRVQIVVDPELRKNGKDGAFDPHESEWLLIADDRIAEKMELEDIDFWMVYRRLPERDSLTLDNTVDEDHEQQEEMALNRLMQLAGGDDSEEVKRMAFAVPPHYWSCTETDYYRQWDEFNEWCDTTPGVVPEVWAGVEHWLHSRFYARLEHRTENADEPEIDTIITNEPTGAQYRVTGKKGSWGVWCKVEFIGNLNWD